MRNKILFVLFVLALGSGSAFAGLHSWFSNFKNMIHTINGMGTDNQ